MIRSDNKNELWFNIKSHFVRFGLQEYAVVTGLKCEHIPTGKDFENSIGKTRLKDKYFKSNDCIFSFEYKKVFLCPFNYMSSANKIGDQS